MTPCSRKLANRADRARRSRSVVPAAVSGDVVRVSLTAGTSLTVGAAADTVGYRPVEDIGVSVGGGGRFGEGLDSGI
ncbi:hypothetical protein GCM10009738_53800 [Kitasatospora viridis]